MQCILSFFCFSRGLFVGDCENEKKQSAIEDTVSNENENENDGQYIQVRYLVGILDLLYKLV